MATQPLHFRLRRSALLAALALSLGAAGCFSPDAPAAYCTSDASCAEGTHCDKTQKKCVGGVAVTVSPATVTIGPGAQTTLSVVVAGASSTAVTWSIQEGSTAGTVTPSGTNGATFVSSGRQGVWHVVAASVASPAVTGTAVVTVSPLQLTPSSASVNVGKTQQFSANGPGTWSVQEAAGGTISTTGLYTAPSTTGTFHVAFANAAGNVTATVTVLPPVTVAITPTSPSVAAKGTVQFTANVTNAPPGNAGVAWTVQEAGGGTISSTGLYTAPNAGGTFHVQVVTNADPLASASVPVSVSPPASVTVSPALLSLQQGKGQQFTAAVVTSPPGGPTAVTWSVQEATGGSVNASGLYVAPAVAGTFHVLAKLNSDLTVFGSATVAVASSPPSPTTSTIAGAASSGTTVHADSQETFVVSVVLKDSAGTGLPGAALVFPAQAGLVFTPHAANPTAAWTTGALTGSSGSGFAGIADATGAFKVYVSSSIARTVSLTASTCFTLPCAAGAGGDLTTSLVFAATPWVPAGAGLSGVQATGITVDPKNPSRLYLASSNGVFISADKGQTWSASGPGPEGSLVTPVLVGAGATPLLYTAGYVRRLPNQRIMLYVSADGGVTWTQRLLPTDIGGLQLLAADPLTPGVLYAAGGGLDRTTDDGLTWTQVIPPSSTESRNYRALAFDPAKAGTVAVMGNTYAYSTGSQGSFFYTATDGKAFGAVRSSIALAANDLPNGMITDSLGRLLLITGQGAVYSSTDATQTWTPLTAVQGANLLALGSDKALYAFSQGGAISRSTDGAVTWTGLLSGNGLSGLSGVAVDPGDTSRLFVSIDTSNYNAALQGFGFVKANVFTPSVAGLSLPAPPGLPFAFDPATPSKAVLVLNQVLYRSADGGASWTAATSTLPGNPDTFALAIDANGLDATGGALWVIRASQLYRLPAGAAAWTGPIAIPNATSAPNLVRADPAVSGTAYVAMSDGQNIFRTTDGGATWSALPAMITPAGVPAYGYTMRVLKQGSATSLYYTYKNNNGGAYLRFAVGGNWTALNTETAATQSYSGYYPDGTNPNVFYFDVQNQMYRTTDGFGTKTLLSIGSPGNAYAYAFAVDPRTPGTLWAGASTNTGPDFLISTDSGANWKRADVGLGVPTSYPAEFYFGAPGTIFLSNRGHGLYRTTTNGQ